MSSGGTTYWNGGSIPLIAPDILGDILTHAADLSLVVSPQGRVLSVLRNPANAMPGVSEAWQGQDIRDLLTLESRSKIDEKLARAGKLGAGDTALSIEVNHLGGAEAPDFPVRYSLHRIGPDGSILMLGRDLRPVAEMQEQLVEAQLTLERDYETQRDFDTRYRVVMETTREAMVFVSLSTGRIVDVNTAAATLLETTREALNGAAFVGEFEGRKRGEFLDALTNAALAEGSGPLAVVAKRTGAEVSLVPRAFRAAGERLLVVRIEGKAGRAAVADGLAPDLAALYEEGVEAIVFTDSDGVVRAANESFLNLTDSANLAAVKGKSLAQFMSRGTVDLKVLLDNAARVGQMRMYATKMTSEFGAQTAVEISATYLADRAHPAVVFVIRDASRAEAMRRPGMAVTDDAVRSVMDLVGSATLKDIVAETTDVVEKMCIETAVDLTRNNRVAAAEMLGLSRQSLYVKLRKYGLLARDD